MSMRFMVLLHNDKTTLLFEWQKYVWHESAHSFFKKAIVKTNTLKIFE